MLDGTKSYCTGALYADYVPIEGLDEDGRARGAAAMQG